jgi:hypothetical protein
MLAFAKGYQFFRLFEQQELIVILDSWQLQHVQLHILTNQRLMRATKYRVPVDKPDPTQTIMIMMRLCRGCMKSERR